MRWFTFSFLRGLALPLLALGTLALASGSYFETSDDEHLAWLFRGVTAAAPAPQLAQYFHGWGYGLAAAYATWPAVPWYGLLLAVLLLTATVLLLNSFRSCLSPALGQKMVPGFLVLVALVALSEHWLWMSHLRVALLLAGSAVVFAAAKRRPPGFWLLAAALLLSAWAIRPSAAWLALLASAPAAWLLAANRRHGAAVLAGGGLLLSVATGALWVSASPEAVTFRRLDSELAQVLDYGFRQAAPRTPADTLTAETVSLWLFGDTATVNPAAVQRAFPTDTAAFLTHTLPAKLVLRLFLLVRDYFPVLALLAVMAAWGWRHRARRSRVAAVQLWYGGLLLLLAGLLKLPPRVALPLLDFWLLANAAAWLMPAGTATAGKVPAVAFPAHKAWRWGAGVALAVVSSLYLVKITHRVQVLGAEQLQHELALDEIRQRTAGRIRVLAGADDLLKSLSPFRNYSLGAGPVVLLTGWPSHEPAQLRLRRQLTGNADWYAALGQLRASPRVVWGLSPATAAWFSRRRQVTKAPALAFQPLTPLINTQTILLYQPYFTPMP